MKSKNINIYFIGRRQGHSFYRFFPSKIENLRKDEEIGFKKTNNLSRTHNINSANILFYRNKPEKTTDQLVNSLIQQSKKHDDKLVINDINSFYNYDSKDRAFKIWQDNNLLCPKFLAFSILELNDINKISKKIAEFLKKYKKIILRSNNETGSRGLYVIDSVNEIDIILIKLKKRINKLVKYRKDTKIICVEYLETKSTNGYRDLYRVHVLFNKIICFYVSTSKKDILYNSLMSEKEIERFIRKNHEFGLLLPKVKNAILNSVEVLGNNIGAVEFFLIKNKPYFIELNPLWGGHAARNGFGNDNMMTYLLKNKNELINKVPNIYKWLDYKGFYKSIYSNIIDYYNNK